MWGGVGGVRVEVGEVWGTVVGNASGNKKSHDEKDSHNVTSESSIGTAGVCRTGLLSLGTGATGWHWLCAYCERMVTVYQSVRLSRSCFESVASEERVAVK